MKKLLTLALCAVIGLAAAAEETFDVVYEASSMKMPMELGFKSAGYKFTKFEVPGYCGLIPDNGKTVLYMDNADPKGKWNNFSKLFENADWNSFTFDIKLAVIGEGDKPQFNISAVFSDERRVNKNSFISVGFGKKIVQLGGTKFPFEFGVDYHAMRIVGDKLRNKFTVYDMDNGGKEIGSFVFMKGVPSQKVGSVSFGDGSSAVEGKVKIEYIKLAFNKTYYPAAK